MARALPSAPAAKPLIIKHFVTIEHLSQYEGMPSRQAISKWKVIPALRVLEIEELTKALSEQQNDPDVFLHRSEMRPDLYPPQDYNRADVSWN